MSGRAADIDPSKLRKELPGRLAFDFRGEGSGFDENAPWSASDRQNFRDSFAGQRASGSGGVRHGKDQTEFQDVKLALGPARLEIDGVLGRAANLDARVVSDDLSAFLPELGGRVNATLLVRERTLALGFTGHDLVFGHTARSSSPPMRTSTATAASIPGFGCAPTASRSGDLRSRIRGSRSTACRKTMP